MSIAEHRKSSFANRLLSILALTILFIFTALVVLENRELLKVFPATWARSGALFVGYSFAILSANYLMAVRGRNFTDWRTELLISANYIAVFAMFSLPHLFPSESIITRAWWDLRGEEVIASQNYWFYSLFAILIPLMWVTGKRVKCHFQEAWSSSASVSTQKQKDSVCSTEYKQADVTPFRKANHV